MSERQIIRRWLSPPLLAEQLGIEPAKVIGWIHRGELRAVNVADKNGKRPRWRISPEALEEFLKPRTSTPPVKATRRKRQADFKEFFPPFTAA
jgi:excisionase family DNA binding protein